MIDNNKSYDSKIGELGDKLNFNNYIYQCVCYKISLNQCGFILAKCTATNDSLYSHWQQ